MWPAKTGHQHPTVTFRRELIRANLRIQSGQPRLPIGAAKRLPASREHSIEVGRFQDVSRKNTLPHLNLTSWVSEFSFRELALVTRGWRFAGTVGTLSSLPWLKRCFILSQCNKPLIQLLPRSVSWASWACMDGFAGGVAVSSCRSCKHDHPSNRISPAVLQSLAVVPCLTLPPAALVALAALYQPWPLHCNIAVLALSMLRTPAPGEGGGALGQCSLSITPETGISIQRIPHLVWKPAVEVLTRAACKPSEHLTEFLSAGPRSSARTALRSGLPQTTATDWQEQRETEAQPVEE